MAEAFALRAEFQGTIDSFDDDGNPVQVEKFRGASFSLPTGETFDVAAELDKGGGVVATEDPMLAEHLRHSGFFKEAPVPDDAAIVTPLTSMSAAHLRALPEANQVNGAGRMPKDELAYRVTLARAGEDPNVDLEQRDDGSYAVKRDDNDADQADTGS